jgi:hypothetical protein
MNAREFELVPAPDVAATVIQAIRARPETCAPIVLNRARRSFSGGRAVSALPVAGNHGQDNVVLMFFELQNELDALKFIADAEVDGGSGTEKVHRFRRGTGPGFDILEVKASFFLLQKYSHRDSDTALAALIHRSCAVNRR